MKYPKKYRKRSKINYPIVALIAIVLILPTLFFIGGDDETILLSVEGNASLVSENGREGRAETSSRVHGDKDPGNVPAVDYDHMPAVSDGSATVVAEKKKIVPTKIKNYKNYFIGQGDVCDEAADRFCTNHPNTVRNLQVVFSTDRKLGQNLVPDGLWGEGTKAAVMAFQKSHGIEPADGWVGKRTKEKLDKVYRGKAYSFIRNGDMCEEAEGQECANEYQDVRNLQIVFNADKNLNVKLDVDGMWGGNTKEAAFKFQKYYKMVQIDGWIGKGSKRKLDELAVGILFPIVAEKYRSAGGRSSVKSGSHAAFKRSKSYPKTFSVYKNSKLLKKSNRKNTRITIDISQQRIKLLVAGEVAIDSPCTTGARRKLEPNTRRVYNKSTPKGRFKITEKIADKRSTIFGKLYRNGKMVWRGDRRKYRGPKAKYVGASLRNWMRLTNSGIGIHGSKYVKRYPATNGCIRVPYGVVKKIFKHVKKGTAVSVVP